MTIIGICGYGQSGKDVAAQVLYEQGFSEGNIGKFIHEKVALLSDPVVGRWPDGVNYRYTDAIKDYGYERAKDAEPEVRDYLIRLGRAVRDSFGEDFWIDRILAQPGDIVIPNLRYHNEVAAVRRAGGAVWRVIRPGYGPIRDDQSEHEQEEFVVDHVFYNDSTIEALQAEVRSVYLHIEDREPW